MLVKITTQCQMGCSHCMEKAEPEGEHMSVQTFADTLDFIEQNKFMIMMISGGEPTDHPNFERFVQRAKTTDLTIIVLTNGLWWKTPLLRRIYLDLDVQYQVINDPKYYPIRVDPIDHPQVLYDDKLIAPVSAMGRAGESNMEGGRKSPQCFNIRSLCRRFKDFRDSVMNLRMMGKMCTPSVSVDGSLVAGECRFCRSFGHVTDDNQTLTNNLCEFRCNDCGLMDGLSEQYLEAVGES